MLNSSAEPVASGADAGCVISDEARAAGGGAEAGSVISDEVRAAGGSADAGSVVSDEVRALAAGADRGGVSAPVADISLSVGDEVSGTSVAAVSDRRAFVDVRRSRLRNRRHVSELCSVAAVLGPTAGFAPSALLVSASSCPVIGKPLRIW